MSLSVSANESSAPLLAAGRSGSSLGRLLLYGSATLGVAVGLERVFGFLSNVLAARIAGPQTFGAYSMVLATAGAIAAYAGAGIGTTAMRFSGQYRPDTQGYRKFIVALLIIALASATAAAVLMIAGAGPLARWLFRNEGWVSFLRLAAMSSAAIVLLECCRGLLVGQRKYRALLVLSAVSGFGLILALPLAAKINPRMMIVAQGTISLLSVAVFLALAKSFGLGPAPAHENDTNVGPGIRSVFTFGLVQFGAFAGISIASWWIASLVVRSDVTLTQMGFYAIANQFRGLVALAPALCAQVGYSLLTEESGSQYGGANHVLLVNSFLASALSTVASSVGIVCAPWLLALVYGQSYSGAEVAVIILLATAVIHMSGVPATQRLNIVGLRLSGFIITVWAVMAAALGMWLVPKAGATGAALAFLISHVFAQAMVVLALARFSALPKTYFRLFGVTTLGSVVLTGLGCWRAFEASKSLLTLALAVTALSMLIALSYLGRRSACLADWKSLLKVSPTQRPNVARS